MSIEGGQGLDAILKAMRYFLRDQAPWSVVREARDALEELQQQQFQSGVSPEGEPHATLSSASRSGVPLFNTGTLMRSAAPKQEGLNIRMSSDLPQSKIQQYGGTIYPTNAKALRWVVGGRVFFAAHVTLPARPYMPEGGQAPAPWVAVLERVTDDFFKRGFEGT